MALIAGSCIIYRRDGRSYLLVLLTNPEGNPRKGLFVGFEDFDSAMSDQTVILCGEHDFIRTTMAPVYRAARVFNVDNIEAEINDPNSNVSLHQREPLCSTELLNILSEGLMSSPEVAPKYRNYFEANS